MTEKIIIKEKITCIDDLPSLPFKIYLHYNSDGDYELRDSNNKIDVNILYKLEEIINNITIKHKIDYDVLYILQYKYKTYLYNLFLHYKEITRFEMKYLYVCDNCGNIFKNEKKSS